MAARKDPSDGSSISIFDPSAIGDSAGVPTGWINGGSLTGGTAASDYWYGYIGDMHVGDFGLLPSSLDGADSGTKYCDITYRRVTQNRVALFGGGSDPGARCGAFACYLNAVLSNSNWGIGASPSCKQFTNRNS